MKRGKYWFFSVLLLCINFFTTIDAYAQDNELIEDIYGANIIYRDDAVKTSGNTFAQFFRNLVINKHKEDSKWDTSVPVLNPTSSGIEVSYEHHNKSYPRKTDMIVYTIPENYEGDININATEDIFRAIGGIYLPGETIPLTFRIINKSNNHYAYKRNSFVIQTENYNQYQLNVTAEAYGFDQSPILLGHTVKRNGNTAIQALYNLPSSSTVTQKQVRDTNLSTMLKEAGYANGSADLGNYYLDFYNQKYALSAAKLEDLPDSVICEMFSGNNLREVETCREVAELGYNWFYNRLLSIIPDSKKISDETNEFTIGNYMRGETDFEAYCEAAFSNIDQDTYTLQPTNIYFNKTFMGGAYQDINLNLCIGFKLKQVKP